MTLILALDPAERLSDVLELRPHQWPCIPVGVAQPGQRTRRKGKNAPSRRHAGDLTRPAQNRVGHM